MDATLTTRLAPGDVLAVSGRRSPSIPALAVCLFGMGNGTRLAMAVAFVVVIAYAFVILGTREGK